MQVLSQQEMLDRMSDDSMVKKVALHILNTPRPDFTELDRQLAEDNKKRLASMDEETRRRVLATPSY